MRKDFEFTDTIRRIERLPSSSFGNPTWLVYFEKNEPMSTQPDTSWSYEADNPEWKNAKVVVTATFGGRIRYCTLIEKNDNSPEKKLAALFKSYEEWQNERDRMNNAEGTGDYPDPEDWQRSDDVGINLLRDLITLLRNER